MNERLMRVGEVAGTLDIAKSTVWLWVKQGILPKPFKLTPSTTVWKHSEIQEFIREKAEGDNAEYPKSQMKAGFIYKKPAKKPSKESSSKTDMDDIGGGI